MTTGAPTTAPTALHDRLAAAVRGAKAGDPLRPVTVVAPSGAAALAARRSLARSGGDGTAGVANVTCTTPAWLVTQLGVPALARRGARPAPAAVEAEVLRAVASEAGDPWAAAAARPGGLAALERAHDELRRADLATLEGLARTSGRTGELAGLLLERRARLRRLGLADVLDLRRAAADEAPTERAAAMLGPVVLLDPAPVTPAEARLLALLGRTEGSAEVRDGRTRQATELRPCADPAEEARAAVRAVVAGAEAGVPLWRQALLHPGGPHYATLLHAELAAAGLPACGPPVRRLSEATAGRALLALLGLAGGDLPRQDVLSWAGSAPLSSGPGRLPDTRRWQAVSAGAGVVRGLEQWRTRLARLAAREPDHAEDAAALAAFVEELAVRLALPSDSWATWSAWALGLLDHYLVPDDRWPAAERDAVAEVRVAVGALGELDVLGAPPDLAGFRAALTGELARRVPDEGARSVGDGVFVGPLALGRGQRFHTVVLVGMGDDVVAGTAGDDGLLPDDVRVSEPTGALRSRARRDAELLAEVEAAVRAGETRRIVTFPRVDPRTGREHAPSRLVDGLVDEATTVRPVDSFVASLHQRADPVLDRTELTLRALEARHRRGLDVADSAPVRATEALARAIEVVRGRAGPRFTRFDGRLAPGAVSPFDEARPVSATRLETYAECPRRFLFERVLGVRARTLPEDLWRIEARDRGSLVHAILEGYVRARLQGAPRSLELLLAIGHAMLDDAAAGGMVGRALVWRLDRDAIVRDLRLFHAEEGDAEPLAAEFSFGTEEDEAAEPVTLALRDGRQVHFLGRADRVDRAADGGLVVSDYKTGRQAGLARLTTDPLVGGRRLQLPLYALAARAHFGASGPVRARYWMVSAERATACYHLELTAEVEAHFADVVGRIARGVESGAFPGTPGPPRNGGFDGCLWCDFDRVCPATRDREWAAKRADPALAPVVELLEADVPESVAGAARRGAADEGTGR